MSMRLVGASVPRVEDARFVTGRGSFVADHVPPGALHAAFVRSPHAHARIVAIDAAAARSAPGVVAVCTAADLAPVLGDLHPIQLPGLLAPDFPALARDVARLAGDPIVVVVAGSRAQADDAAQLVVVDYEPLTSVVDMDDACRPDAQLLWPELGTNVLHHQRHVVGSPADAIADAPLVVRERFRQHRVTNAPMECRGAVAEFDPAAHALRVTAGHQSPHDLRLKLAGALGLPAHSVRVTCADMGGSFGQKSGLGREEVVVAAVAVLLRRTVAWLETRTENLLTAGQAREERVSVEAGFALDGRLLGLRVELVLDLGAYPQVGYPAHGYANLIRSLLPAAYRLTDYEFEGHLVATNKATYVPYRGPWEIETFVRERLFDVAARRLGIARTELRRRNLLDDTERDAGSCLGVDLRGATVRRTLEQAIELVAERGWEEQAAAARADGRLMGVGWSCYVEPAPVSPSLLRAMGVVAAARTAQEARLRLEPDGTLTVFTSQQPHGQGHQTTLAQLAADRVGLPLADVRVVWGDTDIVPYNLVGTGGSRSATLASGAVLAAADQVGDRLLRLASELLEISVDDLELSDGAVVPKGAPSRALTLRALAAHAYARPGSAGTDGTAGLEARGVFLSEDGTWSQATHCCLVEIDAETGRVEVLGYLVVEDCGPPIHPAIVDGQIRGGVTQGIGAVLLEHAAYGPDGQPLAVTFADYAIPSADVVPTIEIHHLHDHDSSDPVPYRGVGEGGAIGSPAAVVSAVEDALTDLGVELFEQHLSPDVVLRRAGLL